MCYSALPNSIFKSITDNFVLTDFPSETGMSGRHGKTRSHGVTVAVLLPTTRGHNWENRIDAYCRQKRWSSQLLYVRHRRWFRQKDGPSRIVCRLQ